MKTGASFAGCRLAGFESFHGHRSGRRQCGTGENRAIQESETAPPAQIAHGGRHGRSEPRRASPASSRRRDVNEAVDQAIRDGAGAPDCPFSGATPSRSATGAGPPDLPLHLLQALHFQGVQRPEPRPTPVPRDGLAPSEGDAVLARRQKNSSTLLQSTKQMFFTLLSRLFTSTV